MTYNVIIKDNTSYQHNVGVHVLSSQKIPLQISLNEEIRKNLIVL